MWVYDIQCQKSMAMSSDFEAHLSVSPLWE